MEDYKRKIDVDNLWATIHLEAREAIQQSPLLERFYDTHILQQPNFKSALAYTLAEKLSDQEEQVNQWQIFLLSILDKAPVIEKAALADLLCQLRGNASIKDHYSPLLYFGSYQALQCYRIAHYCWKNELRDMANYIQSQVVSLFGVDIHPAAVLGKGLFIDHAVGIVIGETAVVEDDVTLFQNVTLGGTGKGSGDRHPKVRQGAFIGSGAVVFGNIEIGEYAKVGGGAIIVKSVPANSTAIGTPANIHADKKKQ